MNGPSVAGANHIDQMIDFASTLRGGLSDEPQLEAMETAVHYIRETLHDDFGYDLADRDVGRFLVAFTSVAGGGPGPGGRGQSRRAALGTLPDQRHHLVRARPDRGDRMSAKIAGGLPKGEANGLVEIVDQLLTNPHKVHVVLALVDCSKTTVDHESGDRHPTVRIKRIEAISGDDLKQARRLLDRAYERRLGATMLPIELEQDLESAFDDAGDES